MSTLSYHFPEFAIGAARARRCHPLRTSVSPVGRTRNGPPNYLLAAAPNRRKMANSGFRFQRPQAPVTIQNGGSVSDQRRCEPGHGAALAAGVLGLISDVLGIAADSMTIQEKQWAETGVIRKGIWALPQRHLVSLRCWSGCGFLRTWREFRGRRAKSAAA